ncbi:hypothetical protein [Rhodothalassium salexigens]|uniref:hypothetical protein n=1 Tax=Rhodothalassium salexigens TaxID=1086 RepID=UPI001912B1DE|nr:hypothetical protein [Rhodothalassium salexigens]
MTSFLPAIGLTSAVMVALLLIQAQPPSTGQMVAWFPAHLDRGAIVARIAAADARLVALGQRPGLAVVWSDRPGLPRRLRAAGARWVLNPLAAAGCGGARSGRPATNAFVAVQAARGDRAWRR